MQIVNMFFVAALLSQQLDNPVVEFSSETVGHTYRYTLTQKMLANSPKWSGSENLPISPFAVKTLAEKYVAKKFPNQQFEIKSISLIYVSIVDRWYFEVTLFDSAIIPGKERATFQVVILTDGRIVEPN